MNVNIKLRKALVELGWSEAELARISGVPQRTVNTLMTGVSKLPYWQTVVQVARAMGISLDWLADEESPDGEIPDWAWVGPTLPVARDVTQGLDGDDSIEATIIGSHDSTQKALRRIKRNAQPATDEDRPQTGHSDLTTRPSRGYRRK